MELNTIVGIIFGVGGVSFITVVVTAYRRVRSGKISDDESIISRLYKEIERNDADLEAEKARTEKEFRERVWWREQAIRYRWQLLENKVVPDDLPGYQEHK